MGLFDDFLLLPNWLKYLVLISILLGTTVTIPLIGIRVGDIFSPFFNFIFGGLGIGISYKEFVIIVCIIFVVILGLSLRK